MWNDKLLDSVKEYSNSSTSFSRSDILPHPKIIQSLLDILKTSLRSFESRKEYKYLTNDHFRELLFAQLRLILLHFYPRKRFVSNEQLFMLDVFDDDSLDELSQAQKKWMLSLFVSLFKIELDFVKKEWTSLSKGDFKDILYSCYWEAEKQSREIFSYEQEYTTEQLQSVFLN